MESDRPVAGGAPHVGRNMKLPPETLRAEATATGFRPEVLEKVYQLLSLLEGMRSHPFLKGRLALKGGTALNLFVFDVPRLSVDVDLNYIGAVDLATMQAERPRVERAIQAVCAREDFTITKLPTEHAGGKWRLRYASALGTDANLELDINFLLRVPLWRVERHDSRPVGSFIARAIPILEVHELAAGKLAALFARHASRDLHDAHAVLRQARLDETRLRPAFVAYGALNRKDWRKIALEDITFKPRELQNELIPVLRQKDGARIADVNQWATKLIDECRESLAIVFPFTPAEREFLDRLLDHGELLPGLITTDPALAARIASHPGLLWKAQNVRQHKGRNKR
jgi:predicted nucleotidyltransferase component of viral defense system